MPATWKPEKIRYAIIVTSEEARSGVPGKPIVTYKGEKFWVLDEPEGWVEASSSRFSSRGVVPGYLKTFKTEESARVFAEKWKGHPWWCVPIAYEIVKVKTMFRRVKCGYKVVS
jgi:hypothetical protein